MVNQISRYASFAILFFFLITVHAIASEDKPKVLYVDSYHAEFEWVKEITEGILKVFNIQVLRDGSWDDSNSRVDLKIIHMDTKRKRSEKYKEKVGEEAKNIIKQWKPDVVIVSDDNACQYLVVPFFKNSQIPFVFCGVNWDASVYGFPWENVTGMVEITLVDEVVERLRPFARNDTVGLIVGNTITGEKNEKNIKKHFDYNFVVKKPNTFYEFCDSFNALQETCGMLLLTEIESMAPYSKRRAQIFVNRNTHIPTGSVFGFSAPFVVLTTATTGYEQGEWAAKTALRILRGEKPSDIPIAKNKQATLYLNMQLAKKLNVKLPIHVIEGAKFISPSAKPRILFVNSYHRGFAWSDEILKGILKTFDVSVNANGSFDCSESGISLRVAYMNTKHKKSETSKKRAAKRIERIVEIWQPDVIIASDDNAAKYFVMPFMDNNKSNIPIVFCGLNAKPSEYGFPTDSITGIVEKDYVKEMLTEIRRFAKGERIGFIASDVLSGRKQMERITMNDKIDYVDGAWVTTVDEWISEYRRLQETVDILHIYNYGGISDWNEKRVQDVVFATTKIPSFCTGRMLMPITLLGITKVAEEQGWWAARTAEKILDGENIKDIEISENKEKQLFINMAIAKKLDYKLPVELLEKAIFVNQDNSQ